MTWRSFHRSKLVVREFMSGYIRDLEENGFTPLLSPFSNRKSDASLPITIRKDMEPKLIDWLRSVPKPIAFLCPADTRELISPRFSQGDNR